jgi:methylase of polypeptide subunit release factors
MVRPMGLPEIEGLSRMPDALLGDLRARLASSGFSPALLIEAEQFAPGTLREPRLPLVRWWLGRRPEPGAALARLFVYDDALPEAVVRDALGGALLGELVEAGLLAAGEDGGVAARFHLRPLEGDLWLLSDHLGAGGDPVMGPSSATRFLLRLVPPTFTGTALDVGCGAGSMALAAARRGARRAVGVDINPRAIALARFNARFNDLRADFELGDGVGPVAGERFDLALAQPPFVVRPPDERDITYLQGGAYGDELGVAFVAGIARVLAAGGRGLVMMVSPVREGESLTGRLRAAMGDSEASLLVLAAKAPPPAAQASTYATLDDPHFGPRYAAVVRRYLDHFDALGIREVRGALVVVSSSAGSEAAARAGTRYTLGLSLSHADYDAATLDRFVTGLALAGQPPELLERLRLRPAPTARLVREAPMPGADAAASGRMLVHVDAPGIGADWEVGDDEVEILACIGAAETVGAAARAFGEPSAVALEHVVALARSGLVHGALTPAAG